ncbi:hypothetical protein GLS40_02215 [Pseudooceanicola sp. 216_PA32_1]|jgi:cytochrome b561|uniref:Cytochrome b561 bacterial/Ni-hydrogenase domain-containing protein n=1 Tax=Pseudooceanicola pacificus TaxID=2676438 RepID=A0A844W161_9RHOB|nr:cytochrome b/b6 domain-containing protein [Pseudooceanicola pacificus]MWB76835.1 hypothetical protein [Pseudooceanicola pacificus]
MTTIDTAASGAGYTPWQKRLHWAVVVLLALQYLVFDGMGRMFHTLMDTGMATYNTVSVMHIAIGVTVLALAAGRLILRVRHGAPAAPAEEPAQFRLVSKLAHWALYLLLVMIPVSGLVAWFVHAAAAAEAHEVMTTILMWLVFLHIAAVAVHQLWWKSGLLHRMI